MAHKQKTARAISIELLDHILKKHVSTTELFAKLPDDDDLSAPDRQFVRYLILTTLRRLGQVDAILKDKIEKPLPEKFAYIQHGLRLGVVQLLWMQAPAYAVVNEMVSAVKDHGYKAQAGLVNAVLKRIAGESEILKEKHSNVAHNIPKWLHASWSKAYGKQQAHQIAQTMMQPAPMDISTQAALNGWEDLQPEPLFGNSMRVYNPPNIPELPGYEDGSWWVQDVAASLPVELLGDIKGKRVLDLCAAPGGKTMQLCAKGAKVTAVERSTQRIKRLKENLARTKFQAEIIEQDVMKLSYEAQWDAILLDAPCSSTGTLRRHPEIMHQRDATDIERLSKIQTKMIVKCMNWLKPGGVLVYCVCSLQPEEGEQLIEKLLSSHKEIEIKPINTGTFIADPKWITANGELRTLPSYLADKGGMDGFYAVMLTKNLNS